MTRDEVNARKPGGCQFTQGVDRAVEGVRAKIAVHICFGNLYGRPFFPV